MRTDVQTWYSELTEDQRKFAMELRQLVLAQGPELREKLKWGQPCYYGNSMVCHLQKAEKHVSLGFGKGSKIADPELLLEGGGSQMRHVKIPIGSHLNASALMKLVSTAIEIDRSE